MFIPRQIGIRFELDPKHHASYDSCPHGARHRLIRHVINKLSRDCRPANAIKSYQLLCKTFRLINQWESVEYYVLISRPADIDEQTFTRLIHYHYSTGHRGESRDIFADSPSVGYFATELLSRGIGPKNFVLELSNLTTPYRKQYQELYAANIKGDQPNTKPEPTTSVGENNCGRRLSETEKDLIDKLLQTTDMTYRAIAREVGVSQPTISNRRKRLEYHVI